MEGTPKALGLKRLCLGAAAAALGVIAAGLANGEPNPWGDTMQKYNIPFVHGSGILVDLGNTKQVNGKNFREPAGQCPVMGKKIKLLQPTKDPKIWPNDYLARVPTKDSPQDTMPLGGGFAMWKTKPVDISPMSLDQLKQMADKQRAKNKPNDPASKKLEEVVDDHGLCAWWAWATYVNGSGDKKNLNLMYRYPFVWDNKAKVCTILAIAMQLLDGPGKYCTEGDSNQKLTWYCFHPEKSGGSVSYNSPYIRLDHAKACPEVPIKGAHFGVWNGTTCARMIPRRREKVSSPEVCGQAAFMNSASDNPTQYTSAPDSKGLQQDNELAVPNLWPAGAFGSDQPHSKGVGINYANWYSDGYCELYDTTPTCFVEASGQLAFTALGTTDPATAEFPPCTAASEGWKVTGYCECGEGYSVPWTCTNGEWVGGDDVCDCSNILPIVLGVGSGLLVPIAIIAGYFLYRRLKKEKDTPETKKLLDSGDDEKEQAFLKAPPQREKHKQSDFLQEAEPSFWGETEQENTNVMLDVGSPQDAYY